MIKPMHVFLSYNDRDRRIAERICEALKQARPDLDIYFAPERNQVGAYWMDLLGQELAQADAVILLLGDRVGDWQEIEYYDALKRNRKAGRPLIAPIALAERLPGLPFLDHFHRLIFERHPFEELIGQILSAMEGAGIPAGAEAEPLWRQVNPYAGLPAMKTEDSAFFVGREALTGEILEALRQRPDRIHTLIGSSGVGKSSVAFAGVLAALRSRMWPGDLDRDWPADMDASPGWLPIVVTPGVKPCKELARSIARTWLDAPSEIEREASAWAKLFHEGSDLTELARAAREEIARRTGAEPPAKAILYVDQGEELYTRAEPADAAVFSRLIAGAITHPDIMVMASLRADYYGQWQADEPFFANGDRIDVPPLTKQQIERVVREPAERLGVRFENPDIVSVIAEATWNEPGGLPMLSYLMQDAWEEMRRDDASDGILKFAFRVVDVSRPLVDRAERFLELHPDDTDTLRRLLTLRLAHVPVEGQPVRRRASRSECSLEEWTLIEDLAGRDWRLLTTSEVDKEPVAEVAHEALLQRWPRLSSWLSAEREFLIWKGQLEKDRIAWQNTEGRHKDEALLLGLSLTIAREWLATRSGELAETDREFIELSLRKDAETTRVQARRRSWTWASSIAALVSLMLLIFAGWQAWVAEQSREEAVISLIDAETALADAETALISAGIARDDAVAERASARLSLAQAEATLLLAQIEQARARALLAENLASQGNAGEAIAVAVLAMPRANPDGWPDIAEIMEVPQVLTAALLNRREMMVLRGHDDFVSSAQFSPDGSRVLTASWDGTARLWDVDSGEQLAVLRDYNLPMTWVGFSADGAEIITVAEDSTVRTWTSDGSEMTGSLTFPADEVFVAYAPTVSTAASAATDGSVRLWDMETGDEVSRIEGYDSSVLFAVFSPDGSRLITASKDAPAGVWATEDGEELAVLSGHRADLTGAAFSPDGTRIVTVASDNTARLWDARDAALIAVLSDHEAEIFSARFSPEGRLIATVSADDTARIWNAVTGENQAVLRGHTDIVFDAEFSANETRLVTTSSDDTARIWNAQTGVQIAVLRGHDEDVVAAAFSPDGNQVVTASFDNTARVWDAASGIEIVLIDDVVGEASAVSLSPDERHVITSSPDNAARVWSIAEQRALTDLNGHAAPITTALFSPDGATIATASEDDTTRLWNAETGEQLAILGGYGEDISSVVFSPGGDRLVTTSSDHSARMWQVATGDEVAVLNGREDVIDRAAFSPNGGQIVTGARDGTARLWDATNGSELAVLSGHGDQVTSVSFSPDGDRVLTTSSDNTARLWNSEDGSEALRLEGHGGAVTAASFSPDGSRIATASTDATVRLWDANTGAQGQVLAGHDATVHSAVFSPDGGRVVTASSDETVRLWDAQSGDLIAVMVGHSGPVLSAVFSQDGALIVTASRDRSARIWRHFQTMDELWDYAVSVVDLLEPLSPAEECEYYLRVDGC